MTDYRITFTLDFNFALKYDLECIFVSSESSLQSSKVCSTNRADNVQRNWLL